MRVLIAGDWHSRVHEEPVYDAMETLGHTTYRFSWHQYFRPASTAPLLGAADALGRKLQNQFLLGPLVKTMNRDLLEAADAFRPDLLFVYRGTHVARGTLRAMKRSHPRTALAGYNNDDPFARGHRFWIWRHFLACLPEYDLVLAYRHRNLEEYRRAGARRVHLLRSWFVPKWHHPIQLSPEDRARFESDVVFVGHYEADGRVELLEEVVRRGYRLRLFGPGYDWDPVIRKSPLLRHLAPVQLVWGEDYCRALGGAKVALCFLSRLNRDTYTRRCFEIPATRTLLLSEYTDDLATLYGEGVEADFFRSKDEMIRKTERYLADDRLRASVAEAGFRRVFADGHDVVSRMRQVLDWVAREVACGT